MTAENEMRITEKSRIKRAPTRAVSRGLTKSYNNKKFYQEIASAPVHTLTLDGPLSCIEAGETLSR